MTPYKTAIFIWTIFIRIEFSTFSQPMNFLAVTSHPYNRAQNIYQKLPIPLIHKYVHANMCKTTSTSNTLVCWTDLRRPCNVQGSLWFIHTSFGCVLYLLQAISTCITLSFVILELLSACMYTILSVLHGKPYFGRNLLAVVLAYNSCTSLINS